MGERTVRPCPLAGAGIPHIILTASSGPIVRQASAGRRSGVGAAFRSAGFGPFGKMVPVPVRRQRATGRTLRLPPLVAAARANAARPERVPGSSATGHTHPAVLYPGTVCAARAIDLGFSHGSSPGSLSDCSAISPPAAPLSGRAHRADAPQVAGQERRHPRGSHPGRLAPPPAPCQHRRTIHLKGVT